MVLRSWILPFLGLALTGTGAAAQPRIQVRSLMPAFWNAVSSGDADQKAQALERMVLVPNAELYGPVIKPVGGVDLVKYLDQLTPLLPAMRELGDDIEHQVPRSVASLEHALGPLPAMTVYVAPSLFTSNGQVRMVKARPVVAFGPDVQAFAVREVVKADPPYDVRALVAHELFHGYHYGTNAAMAAVANRLFDPKDKPPLYLNLWIEGLATCASMSLDGDGSVANALMSDDMPARLPAALPTLASELRSKMHSSGDADYRDFFWGSSKRTDIPVRSAYGVGALVADQVVRRVGLRGAAQLRGKRLEAAVSRALTTLSGKNYHARWENVCVAPRP